MRLAIALMMVAATAPAKKAPAPKETPGEVQQLREEVAKLRQAMIQMLQQAQQRDAQLLQYLQSSAVVAPPPEAPATEPAAVKEPLAHDEPTAAKEPAQVGKTPVVSRPSAVVGSIAGKVVVEGTGQASEVYVYVVDVKAPAVRGKTFEIAQRGKQFSPRVGVVQKGTRLIFPNEDAVFHNVFSPSKGNTFDLGTYRSGDEPRSVVMTQPGVVELFCNLHSRMSASVLVVPNALFSRADASGGFRIDAVPAGVHQLIAWAPNGDPAELTVTVAPGVEARADFSVRLPGLKAHLNKLGQPYGSYDD